MPSSPTPLQPDYLEAVLNALQDWVRKQLGISFTREHRSLFAERITGLCRDMRLGPEELLRRVLAGDNRIMMALASVVSTNYTFFFREPESFEFVNRNVFSSMPPEPLRIWSAATSSGDEAFSLAILARERFGEVATACVRILGTDVSEKQLEIAERGEYLLQQLSVMDQFRLARWFTPAGAGTMRVTRDLEELCTFRRLNLAQLDWPFERRFHLIFLRNVLYYFEPDVRAAILDRCYDFAEPGAYLITSLTEPMLDVRTRWCALRPAIFQKR